MPSDPLTIFETQKYYQNEPNFNGVHSRNNLPKIKAWTYVTNLDDDFICEWYSFICEW